MPLWHEPTSSSSRLKTVYAVAQTSFAGGVADAVRCLCIGVWCHQFAAIDNESFERFRIGGQCIHGHVHTVDRRIRSHTHAIFVPDKSWKISDRRFVHRCGRKRFFGLRNGHPVADGRAPGTGADSPHAVSRGLRTRDFPVSEKKKDVRHISRRRGRRRRLGAERSIDRLPGDAFLIFLYVSNVRRIRCRNRPSAHFERPAKTDRSLAQGKVWKSARRIRCVPGHDARNERTRQAF